MTGKVAEGVSFRSSTIGGSRRTSSPATATCPVCQSDISNHSRFCSSCGRPVEPDAALATQTVASSASSHPAESRSVDESRFLPGAVLAGRYRIVALLGRGGMGEVYRADDLTLGQQVALKFLPESLAGNPDSVARFRNEVKIARQVSHPNVCRVYDLGDIGGHFFLSMEYMDGEDLASLLRRIGRLPADKALEIMWMLERGGSPAMAPTELLLGMRTMLGAWLMNAPQEIRNALFFFFLIFLLRSQWLAAAGFVLIFTVLSALENPNQPWATGAAALLVLALQALVVLRWGLLSLAVGLFVATVLARVPATLTVVARNLSLSRARVSLFSFVSIRVHSWLKDFFTASQFFGLVLRERDLHAGEHRGTRGMGILYLDRRAAAVEARPFE